MKKLTVILILSAALMLTGCGSENVSEASQTEKTDEAATAITFETANTTLDDQGSDLIYETDEVYFIHEGKKWVVYSNNFISDFKGIPDLKDVKGNSSLNNKYDSYQAFCYDEENTIYFANPKDNQYICSYNGKDTRRIAEIPAFSLNYYDGSIYFLSKGSEIIPHLDSDSFYLQGYPYEYNLKSGELKQLSEDTPMRYLNVGAEGMLYIQYTAAEEKIYPYVYDFDKETGESTRLYISNGIVNIDDYHFAYTPGNLTENSYVTADYYWANDMEEYHIKINGVPIHPCVVEGNYYYQTQDVPYLNSFDLSTGKFREMVYSGKGSILDYTVFNGEVYITAGPECKIFRWNNNEFEDLNIDDVFLFLYSGPDAIYGWNASDFVEIKITEDGVTLKSIA